MAAPISLQRRTLVFRDLDDAVRDAENLLTTGYERAGNWSLAQCCSHLSEWMRFPLEGFPKPPAPIRAVFWTLRTTAGKRMLRSVLSSGSMPAGRPTFPETVPTSAGDDRQAVAQFQQAVARFKSHVGPLHPSPMFGSLDHETAMHLQRVHCAPFELSYSQAIVTLCESQARRLRKFTAI